MKVKNIATVSLIALILTSCAPALTFVPPTATALPLLTSTSIAPTVTFVSTPVQETEVPISEPTSSLSAAGPWLVYRHNALSLGYADVAGVPEEFVLLNQDGSGRTSITLPDCDDQVNEFLMQGVNSANGMAEIGRDIYLFRPTQATGLLVYRQLWYSACDTYFSGDVKGGLLASFYQASKEVSPELILYELPGGKIRERFPLVRCSKDTDICENFRSNWPEMMWQQPSWSPNGRYLAFVAILDATSSDLFVYDAQKGDLRRLTSGPDWVGPIQWSPDGTHIIMQELLKDSEFLFDPHAKPPSSVWSVSVSTNEIKLLYPIEDAHTEQNILFWQDDKHYFAYEGFLVNADQARDLRWVDMEKGTNRILFDGEFVMIEFDPVHQVFALYELQTEKYPQGIYLVSATNGNIRYLKGPAYSMSFPDWDERSGLFVSEEPCENDANRSQAFDYQGTLTCIPKPMSATAETANYPAPNGKWNLLVNDGLWLESADKPSILVSQETARDVIWCPDSSCFFFSTLQKGQQWTQTLYRVSIADLTVKLIDEGIESGGTYQWLGIEP